MHNIEYFEYGGEISRENVQRILDKRVQRETYQEGGHGLDKPIRWLENEPICLNYETAKNVIRQFDNGWYDQLAIRYYAPDSGFMTKKYTALCEKVEAAYKAYCDKNYIWAKRLKAEYVGCKTCGSKLKREYITTNKCPVCRADLRPETTLKAVEAAYERWKKAQEEEKKYKNVHAKKKVMWLVKIEYHT